MEGTGQRSIVSVFVPGAVIGLLGGLLGLGGAEFRLPLLLGPFAFLLWKPSFSTRR
jgi:hypothetical protein